MICNVNKIPIYYQEYGKGTPILALHGYYVDHRLMTHAMEPVFKTIEDGYRRIYIDLPGMGQTPGDITLRNSDDILSLLAGFIERVCPNENILLVGESFGGYLSLGLLHKMKEKIDGIFLICPCVVVKNAYRTVPEKQIAQYDTSISADVCSWAFKNFLERAVVVNDATWTRYQDDILPGIEVADRDFLEHLNKTLSFEQKLSKIQYDKPVTFLLGKQDHIVGYQDMFPFAKSFSRGTFAIIDGTGHNLQMEKPELFALHLKEFLQSTKETQWLY